MAAVSSPAGAALWSALESGARELPLPGRVGPLPLTPGSPGWELECLEALRTVPGKRVVLRAQRGDVPVLAKLFTPSARRQYERELAGYALLSQRGVPTPTTLGSCRLANGSGVVLYEWLPEAEPLVSMERPPEPERFSRLLDLVAQLNAAGLCQTDPHGGNFLCAGGQDWCIDPAAVEAVGAVDAAAATTALRKNLALLIAQFPKRWQPAALAQLLVHPLGLPLAGEARAGFETLVEQAWQTRKRMALAKCYRDTTAIHYRQSPDRVVAYRRAAAGPQLDAFFADPDATMATGEMLKDGNSATVVRCQLDGRDVVIKRYNVKGALHWLRRCWRPSRAWVSWGNAFRLELLGLVTPPPIGFMESRTGPLRGRAWYLCDFIAGEELLTALRSRDPTDAELDDLLAWFRLAAQEQLVHGDLKATNLFAMETGIGILDLDAMREVRNRRRWSQLFQKDLARFLRNWPSRPWLDVLRRQVEVDAAS